MRWRDILNLDLGALLFRREVDVYQRTPRAGKEHRPPRTWRGPRFVPRTVRYRYLIQISDQLAAMVRQNLSLPEGLARMANDAPGSWLRPVLNRLEDDLRDGYNLSEAMARRPRFFPRYYVDLVRVGEENGRLAEALEELAHNLLHTMSFSIRINAYIAYFVAVPLVLSGIVLFLIEKIYPIFWEMVHDLFAEGSGTSSSLFAFTAFYEHTDDVLAAFGLFVVMVIVTARLLWQPDGFAGRALQALLLRIPGIKGLVVRQNLGVLARLLDKMLAGGMPLDQALDSASGTHLLPPYRRLAARLKTHVLNGNTLSAGLASERALVPESFCAMVSLGESTGSLPEALCRIGTLYTAQARRTARVLLDVLAPVPVLIAGVFVLLCATAWMTAMVAITNTLAF